MTRFVIATLAVVTWLATDPVMLGAQTPTPLPAVAPQPGAPAQRGVPPQPGAAAAKPPVAGQPGAAPDATAAPAPAKVKYYRWIDKAGVVHYADTPPPSEPASSPAAATQR